MRRLALAALLAASCGGSQPPAPVVYEEPSDPSASPVAPQEDPSWPSATDGVTESTTGEPTEPAAAEPTDALARELLGAHNRYRAHHCARPLVWSADLARTASDWAAALRDDNCAFQHSQTAYGENLAAGTSLSGAAAVELWYREAEQYNYRKHGFSMATGHFTQMVWAATRAVGCGTARCQGMQLWVCHYDPPGNVLSLFPENVQPASCK